MSREVRLGLSPLIYALATVAYALASIWLVSTAASSPPSLPEFVDGGLGDPSLAPPGNDYGVLVLLGQLLWACTALAAWLRGRRLQRGTRGRMRTMVAASFGLLHVLFAWLLGVVSIFHMDASAGEAFAAGIQAAFPINHPVDLQAVPGVALLGGVALTMQFLAVGMILGAWYLLPVRVRQRTFVAVDVVIAGAFVYTAAQFPLFPSDEVPASMGTATTRLIFTVLFGARLLARALPLLLDWVEKLRYETWVAARHLRAKKSGFLATIGTLSIMAVAFSSCSLTTTLSVMGGFRQDLKEKILGNNAHIVVDRESGNFEGWAPLVDSVRETPDVVAAAPVVSGEVMISSTSNLAGALLRGIEPESIAAVTDLEGNMRWGRLEYLDQPERLLNLPDDIVTDSPGSGWMRRTDDDRLEDSDSDSDEEWKPEDDPLRPIQPLQPPRTIRPGIILGQELARSLRVYVGDEVDVVSPFGDLGPTGPMPRTRSFRVAGIFYSGMYEYDMKHAYILLTTAQRFLNTGDAITRVEVKVNDVEQAPLTAAAIQESLRDRGYRVRDWQELNRNLFGALALEKLAMFIALGLGILVAGCCVFGTLTLMVQEKSREVGILKSLGASRRGIVRVFMFEGLMIGFFGAAIGLGLGFVVGFVAENFGVRLDPQVYYIDRLPVVMDPIEFLLVGVASATVSILATIVPATLASRMQPVEALRHE